MAKLFRVVGRTSLQATGSIHFEVKTKQVDGSIVVLTIAEPVGFAIAKSFFGMLYNTSAIFGSSCWLTSNLTT